MTSNIYNHKHPVLVIGAGPTGLSAANLLGTYGIPAVLVEANLTVNRHPRATFLDDEFFRLLETIGLADIVRRQSLGPATYEQYSPLGFLLSREEGQITDHNYPTRSAIFQPWFDQTLLDGLERFDHVETLLGHEVIALEEENDAVSVKFRTKDGKEFSRQFSYVIAADGSRSWVRERLGIEFEAVTDFESRSLRVDVEGDPDTTLVMRSRPSFGRHASSFPAPNGRRYGFSVKPGEDTEALMSDASLKKLLSPFREFSDVKVIRKVVYSFRTRVAKELRKGRVFLLGDAAHVQPPSGSQGMNGGARDANYLTWRIAAVMRGTASEIFLDTYQEERYPSVRSAVIAAASGAFGRKRSPLAIALSHIGIKLRSLLNWNQSVEQSLADAPHVETGRRTAIKSGLLVGDPAKDKGNLLGHLLSNPWIERNHRAITLDDLLGHEFSIIGVETWDKGASPIPAGLSHPLWKSLKTNVVVVQRSVPQHEHESIPTVRVLDARFDEIWKTYAGLWLVVRPDRIVAAITTGGELEFVADQFAQQLGSRFQRLAAAA